MRAAGVRRRRLSLGGLSPGAALPPVPALDTRTVLNALPPQVQQTYASIQAKIDANVPGQTAAGAQAAADLATHGYDSSNPEDNAKLVHAISGGLAAIPGPGIILAGAVETLWAVGNAVAGPLDSLLGNCTDPRGCCSSSGNFTYAQVAGYSGVTSAPPVAGTLGALLVPALVQQKVDRDNCKGTLPADVVEAALISAWNEAAEGAFVDYFAPTLAPTYGRGAGPGIFEDSTLTPYAYRPMASVPSYVLMRASPGAAFGGGSIAWRSLRAKAGPLRPPRVVSLHAAPRIVPVRSSGQAPSGGHGKAIAVTAGVAVGGGLLAWLALHGWRWVTPRPLRAMMRG